MAARRPDMGGTFVWFDLSTEDMASSTRFYTALMGWTTEAWNAGGGMPYTMFKGEDTFGGVMPLPKEAKDMGAPPNWMGYVAVNDVDAACVKTGQLGGRVLVPGTDIPEVGRFAVVADPAGAVLAVFASKNPGEGTNAVAWAELSTTDPDASWAFLSAMFGWKHADRMEMPGGGVYQMIRAAEGEAFAGMSKAQPGMPMSAWAYYFACADCRAAFTKAKEMGCTELYAPMQVPGGGWAALLVDPQGAAFGLFSMA